MSSGMFEMPPRQKQTVNRRAAALAVVASIALAVIVFSVLMFTGVIRFGSGSVSNVTVAGEVTAASGVPEEGRSSFTQEDERIYACARVRAFDDTVLGVRWFCGGEAVSVSSGRFSALARSSTGKFVPGSARVCFFLEKPEGGWAPGEYTVRWYLDGTQEASAGFVVDGQESEDSVSTVAYRDGAGRFTVEVPVGWASAEESTLQGALAGFVAPSGDYPPRFAVLKTDLASASPSDLNPALQSAGVAQEEQFVAYSLGESPGARRTYSWELEEGGKTLDIRSAQVVLQGGDGVYALLCHALQSEYERVLPVFDAVINSFRLLPAS